MLKRHILLLGAIICIMFNMIFDFLDIIVFDILARGAAIICLSIYITKEIKKNHREGYISHDRLNQKEVIILRIVFMASIVCFLLLIVFMLLYLFEYCD